MNEILLFFIVATFTAILAIASTKILMKNSVAATNALILTIVAYIIAIMAFFVGQTKLIHLTWAAPIALISILISARYFSNIVSKPLKNLTKTIDDLSVGNLKIEFDQDVKMKNNELGEIAKSLSNMLINLKQSVEIANKVAQGYIGFDSSDIKGNGDLDIALKEMVTKLREVIGNISQAAENVASGSEQISISSQNLAQGANEQASAAEEASSSLEEMAASIGQNSDNAGHTSQLTSQIKTK